MYVVCLPFPKQALVFTCLQYKSFENTVGKGEIARNEQFLLFPHVFSTHLKKFLPFLIKFEIVVCKLFQYGSLELLVWERVKRGLVLLQKVSKSPCMSIFVQTFDFCKSSALERTVLQRDVYDF